MSEYTVFTFFTIFIWLYFVFMIPMGGAEVFDEDFNFTEDDMTITPDVENRSSYIYHLEDDALDSENVQFYDLEEVDGEVGSFTSTDDYDINRVVGRDETGNESWIVYPVDSWEELDVLTTNRGLEFNAIDFDFDTDNETESVAGAATLDIPDSATTVNVSFRDDTDEYLYYMEGRSGTEFDGVTGALNYLVFSIINAVEYLTNLLSLAAALPFYLNIPFMIYIGYLLYKAVTLG